jgi:D-alanyl-D-alanine carboxypeptidase
MQQSRPPSKPSDKPPKQASWRSRSQQRLEEGLHVVERAALEVPEAVRDGAKLPPKGRSPWLGVTVAAALGTLALGGAVVYGMQVGLGPWARSEVDPAAEMDATTEGAADSPGDRTLLGHLPYDEAPVEELKAISADGRFLLRTAAADAFLAMQRAARRDGITLVTISAFRGLSDQQRIFFDIKAQRQQAATERAEVSAPPGYSEHHTGYAIDLGDALAPTANLSEAFERTAAFRWLEVNAARFNFELSFPRGNRQGIAYEPWHWRFVGDRHSLETFYLARDRDRLGSPAPSEEPESPESSESLPASPEPSASPGSTDGEPRETFPRSRPWAW